MNSWSSSWGLCSMRRTLVHAAHVARLSLVAQPGAEDSGSGRLAADMVQRQVQQMRPSCEARELAAPAVGQATHSNILAVTACGQAGGMGANSCPAAASGAP